MQWGDTAGLSNPGHAPLGSRPSAFLVSLPGLHCPCPALSRALQARWRWARSSRPGHLLTLQGRRRAKSPVPFRSVSTLSWGSTVCRWGLEALSEGAFCVCCGSLLRGNAMTTGSATGDPGSHPSSAAPCDFQHTLQRVCKGRPVPLGRFTEMGCLGGQYVDCFSIRPRVFPSTFPTYLRHLGFFPPPCPPPLGST